MLDGLRFDINAYWNTDVDGYMRKKRKLSYKHPIVTKGEAVYWFVRDQLNSEGSLLSATRWMTQIDNPDLWSCYVEEFISLNLTGRLIASGRSLKKKYDESIVFHTEFKSVLSDLFVLERQDQDRLFRIACDAVEASLEKITDGTRKAITAWAKSTHPYCYLCGRELEFCETESVAKFTIDHLWPRDFGGDSIAENLLPACKDCNSRHKKNYPTWAMTNIHSLLLGIEPSEKNLERVTGSSRYAIHHRYVQRQAIENQLPLKDAYVRVGPSEDVRVIDRLEFGHFFNLANHKPE